MEDCVKQSSIYMIQKRRENFSNDQTAAKEEASSCYEDEGRLAESHIQSKVIQPRPESISII